MRVNPNQTSGILLAIQQSEQSVETATSQLSSGKRVSSPSDDPVAYAAWLRSSAQSASVDRYTKNSDAVLTRVQTADSALSDVVTSLNRALTIATEGASSDVTTTTRAALATQVQGILSDVLSQANLTSGGANLFTGTVSPTAAFTASATATSGFTYNGNSDVNEAAVGDTLSVATNIPGDQIFMSSSGSVLGSLSSLVTALQTGSSTDIGNATSAITSAISHVGQIRVQYADTTTQLNNQESYLSQETISLTTQQSSLTAIDLATAATNLTQAETAHSAVLAAAAKILPTSLLDYLK